MEVLRSGMGPADGSSGEGAGRYPGTRSTCQGGEAYCLRAQGKYEEAEVLLEANVEYCKKKFGPAITSSNF